MPQCFSTKRPPYINVSVVGCMPECFKCKKIITRRGHSPHSSRLCFSEERLLCVVITNGRFQGVPRCKWIKVTKPECWLPVVLEAHS